MATKRNAKSNSSKDQDMLRQQDAALFLQDHLKQPEGYWLHFLINNRRPERKPAYRVPFIKRGGGVFYAREHLAAFLEHEKHSQLVGIEFSGRGAELMQAYGIGTSSGGPYGRTFDYQLTAQSNESGPHVQLIINDPLLVFRLPPEQVDELAAAFASLARELKEVVRHE